MAQKSVFKELDTALFDCRVFNVPNKIEAANYFVWRERDATRNSIMMAAQSVFSHKELHKKTCKDAIEMLFTKGILWQDYPHYFKRGQFVRRTKDASNRTLIKHDEVPKLSEIGNLEQFLFEGYNPCQNG